MIGSPERVKIQRSSIPKIRKIHSGVWKLKVKTFKTVNFAQKMAKFWQQMTKLWPSQNFPGIYTMNFSKKITRVVSVPQIMKIYSGVWKIYAKNTQKWLFWPNWQNFDHFLPFWGSKFCHIRIFPAYRV